MSTVLKIEMICIHQKMLIEDGYQTVVSDFTFNGKFGNLENITGCSVRRIGHDYYVGAIGAWELS